MTSGASPAGKAVVSERVRVLYVRYAAGLRGTMIGGSSVDIAGTLARVDPTGTVNSVQSVLVRFPEVVVVHDADTTTSTVVHLLEVTLTHEVRGTWSNCCCTSGRLSR